MGSRIQPAMADGRSFTNYVSSGLYNNNLEQKFKTPEDSQYRQFLQNNAQEVRQVTNQLTAYYVRPPTMAPTAFSVPGIPPQQPLPPVNYNQKILGPGYYKTISKFNKAAETDAQRLKALDKANVL
jgi:hypothetical protein